MIEVIKVKNREEGNLKAHDILKTLVDKSTLLALSGGRSPDYAKMLVEGGDVFPGAVCIIDERFGEPYHMDSNEFVIRNFGVENFLISNNIEYHRILEEKTMEETARDYNQKINELFSRFPNKVGVMGMGADLHTAGIFPQSKALASEDYVIAEMYENKYPKRVTMTMKALSRFQNFIILVFDVTKKPALFLLTQGKEKNEKIFPGIFYRNAQAKCYLITSVDI